MSMIPDYVFPPGTSPMRKDKDLYLLHCRYSRGTDTLRVLYKNVKTNEKILDEIRNPQVPVYFAKQKPKFFVEYMPFETCYPVMVSERNKSKEIQSHLFSELIKSWKFTDPVTGMSKTMFGYNGIKPETMKKKPEYLHPQLLFADVPISHLCCMEYCLHRYEDVGDGVRMEVVTPPKINLASFDIETGYDENKVMYINTNTFVDDESMTAYIYYLLDDEYKNQPWIAENPEKFDALFREKFKWAIDNMELDAKQDKIDLVRNICTHYLENIKLVTKGFETEQKLVYESCETMFTKHSPDLLMAFNTGFDAGMFQRRVTELGLPAGTFNSHVQKAWIDTPPPIADDLNDHWELQSDCMDPKKRATAFDNISKTHIVDYANAYYSNRKGDTFSSMSLNATAEREAGLGKLDYSHICNHVLKLPYEDFITHAIYAVIDSLLLLILEKITHDFDSKMAYVLRTKSDMKSTAYNNQAISRCIHAEAFYSGNVAGNNWKKYLEKFTFEELKQISEVTKIDYIKLIKLYETLPGKEKGDIKGGIVGNPNKMKSMFKKLASKFNILKQEVVLTRFMKFLYAIYIDAKSHYPYAFCTRNISITTMYGDIVSIIRENTKEVFKTARWKDRGKENYIAHLGGLNLTLTNEDPIAFGERVMSLPSMSKIASKFISFDTEPLFTPKVYLNGEVLLTKEFKVEETIIKVLAELNSEKLSSAEVKNGITNPGKHFLLSTGETTFMGSYIKYDYKDKDIASVMSIFHGEDEPVFARRDTGKVVIDNSRLIAPESKPEEHTGEWISVSDDMIKTISEAVTFTSEINLGNHKAYVPRYQMYFPFKYYLDKQLGSEYEDKGGSNKYVMIEDYKYRVLTREATYSTEFKYTLRYKDYEIDIIQIIDWVNLDEAN